MSTVECTTHYGHKKVLSKDRLTFRPSAYAIIRNNNLVLLLHTHHTGTYSLPGGGINLGEPIELALKREVQEETGIKIDITKFYKFEEQFFYYDPLDVAFHSFLFFYICKPITLELCDDSEVDDGEVEKPRWIDIEQLREEHFHNHGQLILEALHFE